MQKCGKYDRPVEPVCGSNGASSCFSNAHSCASGGVWVTFKTTQAVKCLDATNLGEGQGGGNKWNGGLLFQQEDPNEGFKTIGKTTANSDNKNRVQVISKEGKKIFAYWDKGACGPLGNDANWDICGKKGGRSGCPEDIETNLRRRLIQQWLCLRAKAEANSEGRDVQEAAQRHRWPWHGGPKWFTTKLH